MRSQGFSLLEVLLVLSIVVIVATVALPPLMAYSEEAQLTGASEVFKGEFREARAQAIASNAYTAIVFDGDGDQATFSVYRDGNRDGVRRADIRRGVDKLVSGPFPVNGNVGGVHVAIQPGTPAIPPDSGTLDPGDAIRFGSSNILSFSPLGTATPGTFYLAGARGRQAAVRVTGGSSRVRVLILRGRKWSDS